MVTKESNTATALLDSLLNLGNSRNRDVVRAPFMWPGSKSRSAQKVISLLPSNCSTYVEPFGGSGAVLLARQAAGLEVYNDRYGGVVALYRCLHDPIKAQALTERLRLSIHAREEWLHCKDTWVTETDDVERAAKWYYMIMYSFTAQGRSFGRATKASGFGLPKVFADHLDRFAEVHERIKNVQIENQDWSDCMFDYDSPGTVFYCDPPYLDTDTSVYKLKFSRADHIRLLDQIMQTQGFVALSGYPNPLYDSYDWDSVHEWEILSTMDANAFNEGNNRSEQTSKGSRKVIEKLWIKEASVA